MIVAFVNGVEQEKRKPRKQLLDTYIAVRSGIDLAIVRGVCRSHCCESLCEFAVCWVSLIKHCWFASKKRANDSLSKKLQHKDCLHDSTPPGHGKAATLTATQHSVKLW